MASAPAAAQSTVHTDGRRQRQSYPALSITMAALPGPYLTEARPVDTQRTIAHVLLPPRTRHPSRHIAGVRTRRRNSTLRSRDSISIRRCIGIRSYLRLYRAHRVLGTLWRCRLRMLTRARLFPVRLVHLSMSLLRLIRKCVPFLVSSDRYCCFLFCCTLPPVPLFFL